MGLTEGGVRLRGRSSIGTYSWIRLPAQAPRRVRVGISATALIKDIDPCQWVQVQTSAQCRGSVLEAPLA